MVDRGRSPIRPKPSPSASQEGAKDLDEAEPKLGYETISFGGGQIPVLFDRDDRDLDETTAQINAQELDVLLAQARPGAPPPPRRTLTTQPYDEGTAQVLLDKDTASPEPAAVVDENEADELELVDADVEAAPAPRLPASEPALATPPPEPPSASPPASTPHPSAIAPAAPRASLPSVGMEWPGAQERKRRTRMVIAIVGALAAIAILYLALSEPEPAPIAPTPTAAPEPPPPPPAPIAPKPQSPAEIDARKALSRLREGMGDCVRKAIGSLPGSSPAVPAAMKQTSGVGYTALPADWKTAVWSCAKFRHDTPMQFQLQWQSVKPGAEAVGLAWVDDDGDGEPDRAFGFRANAKGVRDVELGEIAPMEMRPVLPVR